MRDARPLALVLAELAAAAEGIEDAVERIAAALELMTAPQRATQEAAESDATVAALVQRVREAWRPVPRTDGS